MEEKTKKRISQEEIEKFINGHDPMERIVNLSYRYQDNYITVFYRDEKDIKQRKAFNFYPFVWATLHACQKLCNGNRNELKALMSEYKIGIKKLSNVAIDGTVRHEFDNGYMFMFFAYTPMSYSKFLQFFRKANNPIYPKKDKDGNDIFESVLDEKQYLIVTPQEQFLIETGKRFFKGYDDYDQVLRMTLDLETTGLDTEHDRIKQLGVRFNRPFPGYPNGFEKVFNLTGETEEEKDKCELKIIRTFFKIIKVCDPDVVCGHNVENFDFNIFIGACKRLGTTFEEISKEYLGESARKETRETILKLGGEIETYYPTTIPGRIVTDSLHAVRRAQAIDSNMQRADLKYVTKYSKMVKPNRVYTPGDKIDQILVDTEHQYAFNDHDGDWYIYDPINGSSIKNKDEFDTEKEYEEYLQSIKGKQGDNPFRMKTRNVLLDGYEIVTGKYIIERYLYDDIWEGDKVEWKFNSTNFLICKMLPIPYKKCTTMGTAGQWKALMLAWSFENGLAIPMSKPQQPFTGGLSRLLKSGKIGKQAKLDYNSLYPSIILTWGISDTNDLMDSMLMFLEYFLTSREKYKGLKKAAGKRTDALKEKIINKTATEEEIIGFNKASADFSLNDNRQAGRKVFCNSFFGSFGNPNVFNWGSLKCAEETTCIGRQSLRMMISHFNNLHYVPVVGDSVTGDTPLFIRYDNGDIDIKPISEIMDENKSQIDGFGRVYDYSKKSYKVLCRSGWGDISYVYCHSANKDIYRVMNEDGTYVDVTKDHSLFDANKNEIKPTDIKEDTKLEECKDLFSRKRMGFINKTAIETDALNLAKGIIDRVPLYILNAQLHHRRIFYQKFIDTCSEDIKYSKTCLAGIKFLKRTIS